MLELAGAAAGIVVLLSLVGSSIMWARFHALDLPATRAVALLPRDFLISVGATTLVLSMLLGVVAVAVLHAIRSLLPPDVEYVASYILVFILAGVLLIVLAILPLTASQRLLTAAAAAVAGGAFIAIEASVESGRRVGYSLFFLITVLGGVLGFARNYGQPVKLDLALIQLKDGSLTSGAYVATSDEGVYFAPDSFDRVYGQLAVIPRDQVASISITEPRNFRSAGARETTPLLARGPNRSVSHTARARQVEKYLAGWAGDPVWKFPPVSFLESERYLRAHLEEFVPSAERRWSGTGAEVRLDKLVEHARGYAGQPVITRGRVLQVIVPAGQLARDITKFLVLVSGDRGERAICAATTARERSFREGRAVEVRGLVIAAGTIATSPGRTVKGVFMQCAAQRSAPSPRRR